jgi:CRISPR/Cas system-associated exonuclease Cas4 (RecB family)
MTPSQETMPFTEMVDTRILSKPPSDSRPMAHSYSRMNVFSSCPLSYKLQYIDKKPGESNDALEIGAAAHEFFDQWVKGIHGDTSVHGSIEEIAAKAFQKEPRNQYNFKDFLEVCKTFAAAYNPDPHYPKSIPERGIAFNREWKTCDWFSKDVMFRVKIDRIDEPDLPEGEPIKKIRIVDYKTGFAGQPDSFQLDIYALVGSLTYPALEQVEIEFYYVKSGFKTVKILNVDDMGVTKLQIEALMMRIEEEKKWKAKPGQKCVNCSVAAYCQEKPTDLLVITSRETAETLGKEVAMLEAQAKAKKKALNTYCKQNGGVEAGGLVWNHYPTESLVVDMGPLLSICVAHQVDPGEVLNSDTKALKKIMKANPSFAAAIEPYIGVDTGMRFMGKKAEANGDD